MCGLSDNTEGDLAFCLSFHCEKTRFLPSLPDRMILRERGRKLREFLIKGFQCNCSEIIKNCASELLASGKTSKGNFGMPGFGVTDVTVVSLSL